MSETKKLDQIFKERGLYNYKCEVVQAPTGEYYISLYCNESFKKYITFLLEWMDRDDFSDRLVNVALGKKNDWEIIDSEAFKGRRVYANFGYVLRTRDTLANVLRVRGDAMVCARISVNENNVAVDFDSYYTVNSDPEDINWIEEQEGIAFKILQVYNVLPNPMPILEDIEYNPAHVLDGYRGEELWIYPDYDAVYVKCLGWIGMPLSQLKSKISYFPVELQQEFEMWRSLDG